MKRRRVTLLLTSVVGTTPAAFGSQLRVYCKETLTGRAVDRAVAIRFKFSPSSSFDVEDLITF